MSDALKELGKMFAGPITPEMGRAWREAYVQVYYEQMHMQKKQMPKKTDEMVMVPVKSEKKLN